MLTHLNNQAFLLVNAPLHPDFLIAVSAEMAAIGSVYAAMALVAALWIWGRPDRRGRMLATIVGVSVAVGINQILGILWYEPRPSVIGLGHTLIRHAADNSFPSDHATFMWSLGLSLIVTAAAKRWGVTICLAGLLVAWARVYVGLHYPIDMVASLLVAPAGAVISLCLIPATERWALPVTEFLYLRTLQFLHLPSGLFPRETLALSDAAPAEGA